MLKAKSLLYALSVIATGCSMFAASSSAQTTFDKKTFLKKYLDASAKLPVKHRKLLSSGYQNLLQVAAAVNAGHIKAGIGDDGGTFSNGFSVRAAQAVRPQLLSAGPGGTTRVSNPALDFINSEMAGFTQSESSSAWCGKIVVAGYNDSGAYLRTA